MKIPPLFLFFLFGIIEEELFLKEIADKALAKEARRKKINGRRTTEMYPENIVAR